MKLNRLFVLYLTMFFELSAGMSNFNDREVFLPVLNNNANNEFPEKPIQKTDYQEDLSEKIKLLELKDEIIKSLMDRQSMQLFDANQQINDMQRYIQYQEEKLEQANLKIFSLEQSLIQQGELLENINRTNMNQKIYIEVLTQQLAQFGVNMNVVQ